MAATSLWHIEGRLKDLISYVENPEKTVPNKEMQDLPTIGGICRIRYGVLHPPRKKRSEKKKTG